MVKKYVFIALVVLVVAAAFVIYSDKHGIVRTSGEDIGVSAGQAILINGENGKGM